MLHTIEEQRIILQALRVKSARDADRGVENKPANALIARYHAAINTPAPADPSGIYVSPIWADDLASAPLWKRLTDGRWWHGNREYPASVVPDDLIKLEVTR